MSNAPPETRSFKRISNEDLKRLEQLARTDLEGLFSRRPDTASLYRDRLLALALCQGAAEHFVAPGRGVNDFDVWAFFRSAPERPFPYRRRGEMDFGQSRFGHDPYDKRYVGRRVDVIGRSIPCEPTEDAESAIRRYLKTGKTLSARLLAERPVVLLHPESQVGRVIWRGQEREQR